MDRRIPERLMLFKLADLVFGLDVISVQEILDKVFMRRVPRSKEHIYGIFDFRQQILPLLDLRSLLSLPPAESIGNVVVVGHSDRLLGLMVDEVLAVLTVEDETKETGMIEERPYILAEAASGGQVFSVLDLDQVAACINEKEQ